MSNRAEFMVDLVNDLFQNTHSWQKTFTPKKADTSPQVITERLVKVATSKTAKRLKVKNGEMESFLKSLETEKFHIPVEKKEEKLASSPPPPKKKKKK